MSEISLSLPLRPYAGQSDFAQAKRWINKPQKLLFLKRLDCEYLHLVSMREAFRDSNCTCNCGAHPFLFPFSFVAVAWRSTSPRERTRLSALAARAGCEMRRGPVKKKLFSKRQPSFEQHFFASFNCTLNAPFVYYPYILPLSTSFPVIVHSLPNSLDPN